MLGLVGEGRVGEERGGGEDDDGDTAGLGDVFLTNADEHISQGAVRTQGARALGSHIPRTFNTNLQATNTTQFPPVPRSC